MESTLRKLFMRYSTMQEITSTKINGVYVNDDQSILAFDTSAGIMAYEAYGDCCSESWFADITGVDALINSTVSKVEEVAMGDVEDGRT